jgi:predicted amidohydrolase YtcJ
VRVEGERIVAVGPDLGRRPGEEVVAARGGAAIPGLHDHHLHLRALAAAGSSVAAGPPAVHTRAELAAVLSRAGRATGPGGWIRAVGYHESVAGDLDRWTLDRLGPAGPVRIQHRSGALWVLNSAALAAVAADRAAPSGV